MLIVDDRQYSENHIWIKKEGDELLIGVTDYAQDNIGEVEFLDLPEPGDRVAKGSCFGSAESSKAVTDMLSPLSFAVSAVNESLSEAPEQVNDSPYESGWMLRVTGYQTEELDELIDANAYRVYLKALGVE